tara:strand:- start:142 stop:357 length:216 start_codon:yes stop_codon:yes gene_type:complete
MSTLLLTCTREVDTMSKFESTEYKLTWYTPEGEYKYASRDTKEEALLAYQYIKSVNGNTVERTELSYEDLL